MVPSWSVAIKHGWGGEDTGGQLWHRSHSCGSKVTCPPIITYSNQVLPPWLSDYYFIIYPFRVLHHCMYIYIYICIHELPTYQNPTIVPFWSHYPNRHPIVYKNQIKTISEQSATAIKLPKFHHFPQACLVYHLSSFTHCEGVVSRSSINQQTNG